MRVNVYAEEMTNRIEIISKQIDGHQFTGLRFFLELPATINGVQHQAPFMHRPGDDDSSAVTFWGKSDLREVLKQAQQMLDAHYDKPKGIMGTKDLITAGGCASYSATLAEIKRRGETMYIMRDAATGQYHQIRPHGYEHWAKHYDVISFIKFEPVETLMNAHDGS